LLPLHSALLSVHAPLLLEPVPLLFAENNNNIADGGSLFDLQNYSITLQPVGAVDLSG